MKDRMVETSQMADIALPNVESPISSREDRLQSIRESTAVSLPNPKRKGRPPKTAPADRPPKTRLPDSVTSLPIKQRAFVGALTDRDSPSFGNKVRSAMSVGYGKTYSSAATLAQRLSNKVTIQNAITDLLDERGLSSKDRVGILSDLANQRTAEILHYDADGNLTQRQVVDNGKLRLQAVVQASKLAGDYARAENVAKAQRDALQPMVLHYAKLLRESLKAPHSDGATAGQGAIESVDGQDIGLVVENAAMGTGEGIQGIVGEEHESGGEGG